LNTDPPIPAYRASPTKRRLSTLATLLSLLLCVATCALWAPTPFRSDTVGWAGWRDEPNQLWHGFGLHSRRGYVLAHYFVADKVRFDDPTHLDGNQPDMLPHAFHHAWAPQTPPPSAFFRTRAIHFPRFHIYFVAAPHWAIAAPLAVAPLRRLILTLRHRRRRSNREGHCRTCGYDLRATPARCPECGTLPDPTPSST
jgi:hypothetical protein